MRVHTQPKGMPSSSVDSGASAIEYALLAALGAVLLIGGIVLFGEFLVDVFVDTCTGVTAAAGELDSSCTVE